MADIKASSSSPSTLLNISNTISYPILVAMGLIPNTSAGSRTGANDNVPSANAIILSNVTSAAFPSNQPTVAQQMQVVSSSALDTAAGIGTQQVTITYLTSPFPGNIVNPFQKKTEIVNMNGLGVVLTTATDIYRVDRFVPSRVGSAGVAIGNISLQSVGGATTFERIDAGHTGSDTCAHYVPKGFGCIVTDLTFGCSTTGGTRLFLLLSQADPSGNRVGVGQLNVEIGESAISKSFVTPKFTLNPDGRETFVIMAVQGRASLQAVSGSFGFIDFPL